MGHASTHHPQRMQGSGLSPLVLAGVDDQIPGGDRVTRRDAQIAQHIPTANDEIVGVKLRLSQRIENLHRDGGEDILRLPANVIAHGQRRSEHRLVGQHRPSNCQRGGGIKHQHALLGRQTARAQCRESRV